MITRYIKKNIVLKILIIGCLILLLNNNGESVNSNESHWSLLLELGAGNLISVGISYKDIGITTGFDFGKFDTTTEEYNSYLIGFGAFYNIDLISKTKRILFSIKPKINIDYVKISDYSTKACDITAEVLIGYHNFYGILAPMCIIAAKENLILFQIGIGYRINF